MSAGLPVIILGGGGHASVLAELILKCNRTILGFIAPEPGIFKGFAQIAYLGNEQQLLEKYPPHVVTLVNGVGTVNAQKNAFRQALYERHKALGYTFETWVHPSAVVGSNVKLGEGTQVMAAAVIQPTVVVGANTIINTGARIDHDCLIGSNVHVAPGVVMCGTVQVENNAFLGAGSVIIPGIHIAQTTMVRAGRTVVKNVQQTQEFLDGN